MTLAIFHAYTALSASVSFFCFSQMEFVGKTGDSGGGMYVVSILDCAVPKVQEPALATHCICLN